jgi:predicted dehydrogenase
MSEHHSTQRQRSVRIAIVGYGFMGRVHSYAFRVASMMRTLPFEPRLSVLCGRKEEEVRRAAESYGFDEWSTDWRSVVERPDIDIVDVCTPPGHHAQVVAAAAAAGKAIICEKPLAENYESARAAADAATRAGVLHASIFNYRHLPAVTLMQQMIAEGAVGEPLLWRAIWLGDEFADPSIPFDWRFDLPFGGSSILDLGAHAVDLARWMVGEVEAVVAQSATFITERALPGDQSAPVTVDDASSALARFRSGARGIFEFAKVCHGRPTDFGVEVNGREGTVIFELAHLNELWYSSAHDPPREYGIRKIRAEHPSQPYASSWWPAALGLGYEAGFVDQLCDLLERWPDGPWAPDLNDALRTQAVCVAMERSAAARSWVTVADVTGADRA